MPRERGAEDWELEQIDAALWELGEIEEFMRPHRQLEIYMALRGWEDRHEYDIGPLVFNCHRRLGKSFVFFAYCWSRCLRVANQICRFIAPSYKQGRLYVGDIVGQIKQFCPQHLHPRRSGDKWLFNSPRWSAGSNESIVELLGVKDGGDSVRGPRSNVVIADEVREMPQLEYLIDDILVHQFQKQEKPLLVLSTTPPKSAAHPYCYRFIPEAKARGIYFLFPGEDTPLADGNEDFTEEDRELIIKAGNKPGSIGYRREILCEIISDPEELIVPEYTEIREKVLRLERPPRWFNAYMGLDFGFQDHNGALFGFVNFKERRLHIQREIWKANTSTGWLANACKECERDLWSPRPMQPAASYDSRGQSWLYKNLRRVADHSEQQLYDLLWDHDYYVEKAEKWDRDAALANLRAGLLDGMVTIDPSCEQLDNQLLNGTWKETLDGRKRDFVRNSVLGHCDLIAALVYLFRSIAWEDNPQPTLIHGTMDRLEVLEDLRQEEMPMKQISVEAVDVDFERLV